MNLQQRFKEKLDAGIFDDVEQKRASGRDILAFIAQEFELAAQEVEKDFAHKFGRGKYEELVHTEMLPFLAAIIRNRVKEL